MFELLRKAEFVAAVAIIAFAIAIFPVRSFVGNTPMLLTIGIAALVAMVFICSKIKSPLLPAIPIIVAGLIARIIIALWVSPVPVSDGLTYIGLARRLAHGLSYVDPQGHLAFFPPGYPLFLTPFYYLFGEHAPLIANMLLYLIGAAALYNLSKRLFDEHTATIAVALFAIWPCHMLLGGVAAKEQFTIALSLVGLACAYAAFDRPVFGLLAGVAFGVAGLAQPGLALFCVILPIAFRSQLFPLTGQKALAVGLTALGIFAVMLPWMARNNIAFHGEFSGISTNGGSVFYRANNELANGIWTAEGKKPLAGLPELQANKQGMEWGKQWILAHPRQALLLSIKKVEIFLGNDTHGAYWGLMRAAGGTDAEARVAQQNSPSRYWAYKVGRELSNAFWLFALGLVLVSIWRLRKRNDLAPLLYLLFYLVLVHSIFESGVRHHMVAFAPLLILAARQLAERKAAS